MARGRPPGWHRIKDGPPDPAKRPIGRPPGQVSNPKGMRSRPPGEKPRSVVLWDLKMAARSHSEEGMEILLGCMKDEAADWGQRIRAIELLWAYGYGRPVQEAAIDVTHKFAVVPAVQTKEDWLASVAEEQAAKRGRTAPASEARKGVGDAVPQPETIDLTAEPDPRLDPDPTAPAPAGSKLN
jgi:hypothetical protein